MNNTSERIKYYLIGAFFGAVSVALYLIPSAPAYLSLVTFVSGSLAVYIVQISGGR